MKRSILASSVAACLCLGLAAPALAAEPSAPGAANPLSPSEKTVAATKPVEKCLGDLRAFDSQLEKDGYWLVGSGYGYGYPFGGYGYPLGGYGHGDGYPIHAATRYQNVRPGYEIRMLLVSANVLARHGQQQPCEDVLAAAGEIYKLYVADMNSRGMPMADVPGWRKQQIAAVWPVTSQGHLIPLRSTARHRNMQYEALGSVHDIVMSPQTGKIAYLVISRGGISGSLKNTSQFPGIVSRLPRV